MRRSRIVAIVVLLLTLVTTWDVYANRYNTTTVFDGWVEGFRAVPRNWQVDVRRLQRNGQVSRDAEDIVGVTIRTNQGLVKVVGQAVGEVRVSYRFGVGGSSEDQAAKYLDRLAVTIEPDGEGTLEVDFSEPSVRPTYISSVTAELEITVPEGVSVVVEGWSSVDLEGIAGDAHVTSLGPTRIVNIGGNVSVSARPAPQNTAAISPQDQELAGTPLVIRGVGGNLNLRSTFCNVQVDGVKGALTAIVSGEKLDALGVEGPIKITEQSAAVTLTNPGGSVDVDCSSGSVYMTGLHGAITVRGCMALVRIQPAHDAGYRVAADLRMSMLFSDYPLTATGDGRIASKVSGQIGDGANSMQVSLDSGTLEVRKP